MAGLVALFLTACAGLPFSSTPTPTPIPLPSLTPTALPLPATPTRIPPTPIPLTSTPIPPTPTATPQPALRITARLDPPTPHAGEEFVLSLSISNEGQRAARGVYVATSGPWDRWTVLDIQPSGSISRDAAGWHIVSLIQIPSGDTQTLEMHIRADEP